MLLSSKLALPAYVSDARCAAQLPGKFGDVSAGVAAGSTCQLPRLAWQQQEQLLRRRVCKTVQTYSLPREGPEPGDHVCKHLQPNRAVTLGTALLSTSMSQWFSFRGKI